MDDKILVVDDDPDFGEIIAHRLKRSGFKQVETMESPVEAARRFVYGDHFDLALIDLNMGEMDGLALLDVIKSNSPNTACIIVTAVNEAKIAVDCIRKGAYDYLVKPVPAEELTIAVNHALERKHLLDLLNIDKQRALPRLMNKDAFKPIITRSRNMLKVLKEAELHARSNVPVLITGESGTGKELLARAIHDASPRAEKPFTPVNMGALTASLFDAEFFGHTRGAFTGADAERVGYLEHTNGGSLFLDEIGILPMELQGKLLRVLQGGEYMKLGTSEPRRTDVRIIAATNEDMEQLIGQRKFRKDLYYRLRGGWLHLPPIRERRADIPPLINHFLREFGDNGEGKRIGVQAMAALMRYDYPGNIRELRSILQSSLNLAEGGQISIHLLPENVRKCKERPGADDCVEEEEIRPLADVEKEYILQAYRRMGKNKAKTARVLGIGLNTLRRRLEGYGEN